MLKIKTTKKLAVIFFILVFSFYPTSFSSLTQISLAQDDDDQWQDYDNYIVIDQDTIWNGHIVYDDPEKPVVLVNGATLTIEKGTEVELLELDVFDGKIIAEGTESEKITFTEAIPDFSNFPPDFDVNCSPYHQFGIIEFDDWAQDDNETPSFFRYVEFNNMGTYKTIDDSQCGFTMRNKQKKFHLFNTALADTELYYNPVLKFRSGRLKIENSEFKNNSYADIEVDVDNYEGWPMSYLRAVNSNFSGNQQNTALISNSVVHPEDGGDSYHNGAKVILKNNWYGDLNGPKQAPDYLAGGEIIKGDYTLDGHRKNDLIADPVIIIPGIMGSAKVLNKWKLDPILHTYDDLLDSLEESGYEEEINLFAFPYNWRESNSETADDLKQFISQVLSATKVSRVDIVAHSMGGLVAREYIESDGYQNDVNQLVTLGTPHRGAPFAYLYWEAGEGFEGLLGILAKRHFTNEAKHQDYDDLQEYIQDKVISVGELLPDYDYLYDVFEDELRNYPDNYPQNNFLEELNDNDNSAKLDKVNLINIIGDLDDEESTLAKIKVVESTVAGKWEHGMPENFYTSGEIGLEKGKGDGTVPWFSAESVPFNKQIAIDSRHNNLPTESQCEIVHELAGKTDCQYVNNVHIPNILLINVFSPIDIQVIAPNGKWVGKNINNLNENSQIDGAYYSGYENPCEENQDEMCENKTEFITIPNPEDGEYKILTQATGDGDYKIEVSSISENEDNPEEADESTAEIAGTAKTGQTEELKVNLENNEVIIENQDEMPPTIEITSPENDKSYLNNQILPVAYTISDNVSPADKIISEIYYDDEKTDAKEIDLSLEHLGNHQIKITAQDEALNESEKTINCSTTTNIQAIINNVSHYYNLGLIKNRKDKEFLEHQLKILEKNLVILEKIKGNDRIKPKIKQELTELFEKLANRHIDLIIRFVETNRRNSFTENAQKLLTESLEFIRPK